MKVFLRVVFFISLIAIPSFLMIKCEHERDPYAEGSHFDYSIECVNGFVYRSNRHGTIQVLNSDGTPLKCGAKIY